LNPAITIGLLLIKKITPVNAIGYICFQILGAGCAALLANMYFISPLELVVGNLPEIGIAEMIGTFILGFGVASVVLGTVPQNFGGIVIGLSLSIGIVLAAPISNGVLNPAVAFGIGSISAAYLWGPLVGATLGVLVARLFAVSEEGSVAVAEPSTENKSAEKEHAAM